MPSWAQTPVDSLDALAKQSGMQYSVVAGYDAQKYFEYMSKIEDSFYDRWKEMSLGQSGDKKTPSESSYQYAVWDYPLGDKFSKMWAKIQRVGLLNNTMEGVQKVYE